MLVAARSRAAALRFVLVIIVATLRKTIVIATEGAPGDVKSVVDLGDGFFPAKGVSICVRNNPPSIMPLEFDSSPAGGPMSLDFLQNATLVPGRITGFDKDYMDFLFANMGLNPTYVPCPSESALYVALLTGRCDMAVSSISLDPIRNICNSSCPFFPAGGSSAPRPSFNVSTDSTSSDSTAGAVQGLGFACCIEYSANYFLSTYGLLSVSQTVGADVLGTLTSSDVINSISAVLLAMFLAGWLIWLIESRGNRELRTISDTLWLSVATLTTVGYGDVAPVSWVGRAVTGVWMMVAVIASATFESIISSQLTAAAVSWSTIDSLGDVDGTLCVQRGRPDLLRFIQVDGAPVSTEFKTLGRCIDGLNDGTYQAVLADRPVLRWCAVAAFSAATLCPNSVSPSLDDDPQAFAFRADERMRFAINPQILRMKTDPRLAAYVRLLSDKYFPAAPGNAGPPTTEINLWLIVALAGIAGVSALCAAFNGFKRLRDGRRPHPNATGAKGQGSGAGGGISSGEMEPVGEEDDTDLKLSNLMETAQILQAQVRELKKRHRGDKVAPLPFGFTGRHSLGGSVGGGTHHFLSEEKSVAP